MTYVTVIDDLERRQVVDLLPDRSAASTAKWIKGHHGGVDYQPRPRRALR
jgi:transposase